jgi:Zn-dependent peptidase ImmA (M78 family)/transcriptional regulator with XRE-family HTH domain
MMNDRQFVGARLGVARAFRQMTLKALADTVSVSLGLLSHYENGLRKQPADDLVSALATALGVKPAFFFEPALDVWAEMECSFRRRVATPEGVKKRARAHGSLIGMVVRELASKVKFPTYNIPAIAASLPPDIEAATERCRSDWGLGLGPIEHVGRVAEKNGVVLVQHLQHADKIDAFARRGDFSVIVLNTARISTSRWIFDVAHELGHFVLHRGIETGSKDTEDQANYFAAALLLPHKTFSREFRARPFSWTHVFDLKRRWSVSAAAIVRRAYDLGLIDAIVYRRSYQHLSVQGWLKREPHEPHFAGPEWLPSAFALAEKRFGLSPVALCERLHLSPAMFTEITGLPVNTSQPVPFRPRLIKTGS